MRAYGEAAVALHKAIEVAGRVGANASPQPPIASLGSWM